MTGFSSNLTAVGRRTYCWMEPIPSNSRAALPTPDGTCTPGGQILARRRTRVKPPPILAPVPRVRPQSWGRAKGVKSLSLHYPGYGSSSLSLPAGDVRVNSRARVKPSSTPPHTSPRCGSILVPGLARARASFALDLVAKNHRAGNKGSLVSTVRETAR